MRFLFISEKERLLNNILSQSNTNIESITLENFEDMSEDDLRSIILIGNGRIRHAYRPESLYSQYVARRGIVRDPQNPSYTLTQEDLNNVFNQMIQRYPNFQPEIFNEERSIENNNVKRLIDDDNDFLNQPPSQEDNTNQNLNQNINQDRGYHLGSQVPHPLLSGRNNYLDELERDFNDMINRHNTKEKRPYTYDNDKGKGPGGFPMRGGNSSNVGMPAKEPLFEPHKILLYDPDNRYTTTKQQIHTLAYTYQFSPYGSTIIETFSPGNNKGDHIKSEKMPEWMTVDPMKRDKVTFLEDNYRKGSYLQNTAETQQKRASQKNISRQPEITVNKDKPKTWWLVIALLLIILLKKL